MSPLFAMGTVLTAAGGALYAMPGLDIPLLALGAVVLAVAAAVWCAARQG